MPKRRKEYKVNNPEANYTEPNQEIDPEVEADVNEHEPVILDDTNEGAKPAKEDADAKLKPQRKDIDARIMDFQKKQEEAREKNGKENPVNEEEKAPEKEAEKGKDLEKAEEKEEEKDKDREKEAEDIIEEPKPEQLNPNKEEAKEEAKKKEEEIEEEPEEDIDLDPKNVKYEYGDLDEPEENELNTATKLSELQERRRQLEQEEEEYRRQKDEQDRIEEEIRQNQQKEANDAEKKAPAVPAQGKKADAKKPDEKKEERNPFKGTVNEQKDIEGTLLDKQQKEVHALRAMTREIDTKSKEYKLVRRHLQLLDEFMQQIAGRTQLSKEEMEKYELLTMRAYKATEMYEKAENERLKASGAKPTKKEQQRILGLKEIQRSISKMREDMYEKELKRKKEEMQKKCQEKMQDMQETLDGLHHAGSKNPQLKEVLGGVVVQTLFYMNRMDTLEKTIRIRPGHPYKRTSDRLDRDLRPSKQDLDNVAKQELTQSIVIAGMKAIKAGEEFTIDDIRKLQKKYIRKNAKRMAQEEKRRANIRNLRKMTRPAMQQQVPSA